MRQRRLVLITAAAFLTCCAPAATACGDKLLMLGRGVKFGSISSSYHGSIIAYLPDSALQSAAINDAQFLQNLRKAGHRLRLVRQVDALADAVRSGTYDLILVDQRDAAMVEKQVITGGLNTVVMPVVYYGAELEMTTEATYRCVRKMAGKNSGCFATIDKAIRSKLKRDEQQRRASN